MKGRGNHKLRQQDVVLVPARDQNARAFREARRSGFLSLPTRNLTEFPSEVYHLEEHLDKDEKKWECVDLVKIDMSHNAIPTIADDISELATLTSFKLSQNTLTALPEGFFALTALTYLDLSHNRLRDDLSESLGNLVNLKELGLTANQLHKLPESLSRLAELEVLRVEENALTHLPSEIGRLKKLHTLTAHSNHLATLPSSFADLRNMQMLDVKKNRLETMAGQLATLHALKYADLRQNQLRVFPQLPESAALDQVFLGYNALAQIDEDSVLRVKDSITVLDLRDNKLAVLPANLACLYRLKTLDLSNNDLSDMPPGLGYLKHLNRLVVDGNPMRSIRRAVISAGCESLKKYLRTRGSPPTGVDVLEEEIDELQIQREREQAIKAAAASTAATTEIRIGETGGGSREASGVGSTSTRIAVGGVPRQQYDHVYRDAATSGTLDLSDCVLQTLPYEFLGAESIHDFSSTLIHVNLSQNHLARLPAELGTLQALQTLIAEGNQLVSIDSAIAQLPRLTLLRLRKNHLTSSAVNEFLGMTESSSSWPTSIALRSCLKELDLRNNQLIAMPLAIQSLTSVETLLLSFNKIVTLDGFPWHSLVKTSVISISDNKLKSLGRIYDVPLLASLSFENNTLTRVPCELGLCPHLRAIYMNGNPQKTVRGGVIAKGSTEILAYLKNKLPPSAVLSPPSPTAFTRMTSAGKDLKDREPTGGTPRGKSAKLLRREYASMYAATAAPIEMGQDEVYTNEATKNSLIVPLPAPSSQRSPDTQGRSIATEPELGVFLHPGSDDCHHEQETGESKIEDQIYQLEVQLENHSLSAAKQYAVKKELAMLRSARIRAQRKLGK